MATYSIELDTIKKDSKPIFVEGRVGDSESCIIKAYVTQDGAPYDFEGKSVRFECWLPDDEHVVRDPGITIDGSTVVYTVPAEVLAVEGVIKCAYFRIYDGTAYIESTGSFIIDVQRGLPGDIVSGNYIPEFDAMLAIMNQQLSASWELEKERQANEDAREAAEAERAAAEDVRASAEDARETAEAQRQANEAVRVASETTRETQEAAREAAEALRRAAETTRETQEAARETAEAKRKADFAAMADSMNGLSTRVLTPEEYDENGTPTIEGTDGIIYLVPVQEVKSPDDALNSYVEWMWLAEKWEIIGGTGTAMQAMTTDQVDAIMDGETLAGNEVVSTTVLSYIWAKIKAWAQGAFAALAHTHSASDITEGTFGAEMLADGAVTADKLAESAVGTAALSDGCVTEDKIDPALKESWDSQCQMYTQDAVTLRVKPSTRTVTARLAKLNIPKSGLVDADVHVTFPMLAEYAPDEPLYFPIAKDRGGGTGLARATVSGPDLLIVANSVNSTGDFYGAATWGY